MAARTYCEARSSAVLEGSEGSTTFVSGAAKKILQREAEPGRAAMFALTAGIKLERRPEKRARKPAMQER
jgi:hypothetical protein